MGCYHKPKEPAMNLNVLRYALEVEKSRSITGAAKQLFISQPNLSRDIRELEEEIGFSIFARNSRGVIPTQRGREFLQLARKAVRQYQALEDYCSKEETDSLRLHLCAPHSSLLSCAFTSFLAKYGRGRSLSVKYCETGALEAIERTQQRDCSFSIIRCPERYEKSMLPLIRQKELSVEILGRYELAVLFSERHPLADSPALTADMLEPYPEILWEDSSLSSWLHEPAEAGCFLHAKQSDSSLTILAPNIRNDILACIPGTFQLSPPVPESVLGQFRLVLRKIQGAPRRMTVLLIFPEDYHLTQTEQAFLTILRQVCAPFYL